jgi:hypothetical protein
MAADRSDNQFIQAQRDLRDDWSFESFEQALRSWIATVAIAEVEYVGEWEEWIFELMARDYLDEVRRRSGPDWTARHDALLGPWDERFKGATVTEPKPHLSTTSGDIGWWQYRSPRRWRRPGSEELSRRARGIA